MIRKPEVAEIRVKIGEQERDLRVSYFFSNGTIGSLYEPPEPSGAEIETIEVFHPGLKRWISDEKYGEIFEDEKLLIQIEDLCLADYDEKYPEDWDV